jgi:hypothetical protein
LIAIGARGILLGNRAVTSPINFSVWFVGGNLIHDLVVAPLVLVVAAALRRLAPARFLGPVQWASALTGIVLLLALIPLAGWGRSPRQPTVQPLNYAPGTALVLGTIWLTAAIWIALRSRRSARGGGSGA